jgi:hypothetical protein
MTSSSQAITATGVAGGKARQPRYSRQQDDGRMGDFDAADVLVFKPAPRKGNLVQRFQNSNHMRRHPGARPEAENPGSITPVRGYGFRVRRFAAPRNDEPGWFDDVSFPSAQFQGIAALVARLRGTGARRPLLLLAHIDVVAANPADWSLDPFKLTEQDGYYYGRGT